VIVEYFVYMEVDIREILFEYDVFYILHEDIRIYLSKMYSKLQCAMDRSN
jgi:hypothetical protein